jgi:hypothetical protein
MENPEIYENYVNPDSLVYNYLGMAPVLRNGSCSEEWLLF